MNMASRGFSTVVSIDGGEPREVYSFEAWERPRTLYGWPLHAEPAIPPEDEQKLDLVIEGKILEGWDIVRVFRGDGRQYIYYRNRREPRRPWNAAEHCGHVDDDAVRCLAKGADAGDLAALAALIDRLLELGREETTVLLRRVMDEQMRTRPKPPVSTGMLRRSIT